MRFSRLSLIVVSASWKPRYLNVLTTDMKSTRFRSTNIQAVVHSTASATSSKDTSAVLLEALMVAGAAM